MCLPSLTAAGSALAANRGSVITQGDSSQPAPTSANSIRLAVDLQAMSYPTVKPGLLVNCPVVPAGSTLEQGEELTVGWYRDEHVCYPDFGENPVVAIPIWAVTTLASSFPRPVRMLVVEVLSPRVSARYHLR